MTTKRGSSRFGPVDVWSVRRSPTVGWTQLTSVGGSLYYDLVKFHNGGFGLLGDLAVTAGFADQFGLNIDISLGVGAHFLCQTPDVPELVLIGFYDKELKKEKGRPALQFLFPFDDVTGPFQYLFQPSADTVLLV